ncbi:hypothetical protein NSZ01_23720 [Nocardioides szechwanensis]|uniref:Murein tripeptide amidase MpaA n=1 Tax=Nocardioides szechwanensis TaxID=1005944 RepID=A0A1H0EPD4_9ACTN|nr:M14 family zinc carboxypeptidase [Nocardioides szechwanensis]GEP34604.1 hypothetical protein NSZ01_23720 [Nocardioides szechwanensis]SDN84264.1 Murein tripeptide amidase MpaA [Nocardioides szechwanensis]
MTRLRTAATLVALALSAGLLGVVGPGHGSEPVAPFSPQLVRVHTDTPAERATLAGLGLDGTEHAGPDHTDLVLHTADDRDRLAGSGLEWQVTIGDLLAREAANNLANAEYAAGTARSPLPSGRTSYRTLEDYDREMRGLAKRRPSLVRTFTLARPTLDGRTVRAIEIGSDVRRPASGRPTFVMLGLHHAREWPSAEHTMEFAHELVRGYGHDARVTRLLDRLRVVLVPVVNADGFDLSRTSGGLVDLNLLNPLDPSGTVIPTATQVLTPGMAYLRKNCRLADGVDTPDGSCGAMLATPAGFGLGVDLNRNYGMWWGGPGAAGQVPSATEFHAGLLDPRYHGAAPFSEPETRNVRDLFLSRSATGMITNHTFGNLVLRPWSGSPDHVTDAGRRVGLARDERAMAALGGRLARQNGYTSQRSYALYDGMGTTEDWAYGATGTYGYTFEIGGTEFHPPFEDVVDHYGRNRAAYLIALEHAADPEHHSVLSGRAPAGARLTLTRDASTATWDGSSPATFRTSIRVPADGTFTWHVNPSTRPTAAEPERYTLTCTRAGKVRQTTRVLVGRGQVRELDMSC